MCTTFLKGKNPCDHQYGFCKASSTGELLSFVIHVQSTALSAYDETFIMSLDISLASYRILYWILFANLPLASLHSSDLIASFFFFSERTTLLILDVSSFSPIRVLCGVPQGSDSFPTIFILFINYFLGST